MNGTAWNSTLRPISKKRQAEIAAGIYKKKPVKPIRKVSKKTAVLWSQTRKQVFDIYGHKCFLCGNTTGIMHVHHWCFTRQQRPDLKYDTNNLVPLCAICHNHSGADKRFYDLKVLIHNKLERTKYLKQYEQAE